jgi:hypothetical protein
MDGWIKKVGFEMENIAKIVCCLVVYGGCNFGYGAIRHHEIMNEVDQPLRDTR